MDLIQLLPRLAPIAPFAPELTLERVLRDGARKFLRDSKIWRETFTVVVPAGSSTAAINLPSFTGIADLISVKDADGRMVEVTSDREEHYKHYSQPGRINRINFDTFGALTVYPAPEYDTTLTIRTALTVLRTASEIPDVIAEDWEDAVVFAAATYLLDIAGSEWYDPRASTVYLAKYDAEVSRAKLTANRENSARVLVAQYHDL